MDFKTITAEDIEKAREYVPFAEKEAFVATVADKCFDKLNITASSGDENTPMPPMYKENTGLKMRYAMSAFVKMYLNKEVDTVEGDEYLMSLDDFDRWAGGHIFNQIERLKNTSSDLRNKCFDLLQDYKTLEKMLNTEVYSLLQVMNEPVNRILSHIGATASPETMMGLVEELKGLQSEFEKYEGATTTEVE